MAKDTINHRLVRVRRSLSARGLDAVLITCPENRYYLSGFLAEDLGIAESAGCLLVTGTENILLTDGRYEEQAREQAPSFHTVVYRKGLASLLAALFRRLGIKRCGYEPAFLSCAVLRALKKAVRPALFEEFGDLVFRMRAVKDNREVEIITRAQQAAERVFQRVLAGLEPGLSEKEVAFEILRGLHTEADGPSFPPIVASGPNSSLPHAVPSDRRIQEGEPVIIDMGARLDGYCSDMTRTVFVGEPAPFFKEIYQVVREAQEAAQDFIRPGVTGREADLAARRLIERRGFGRYFSHGLGHGVGIAIHEAPALSYRNRKRLRPGMVVTVEPGIYVPGRGGVRLENMVVVTKEGTERITSSKWYYDF